MNLMDDEDLKKSVIDQMMGELDDVTAGSLKRKPGMSAPVKGVEIAITVSPKSEEAEDDEDGDEACDVEGCEDPAHGHEMADEKPEGNYINDLLKKLG